jgi:hypothetical protein
MAATINLSSQLTDFIMTLLTQILAQTARRAILVTVPTEARTFGPLLIFGSPVPAGNAVEAIIVEIESMNSTCKVVIIETFLSVIYGKKYGVNSFRIATVNQVEN